MSKLKTIVFNINHVIQIGSDYHMHKMQIIIDERLIWKTVKYTDIFADHNHSIGLTSVLISMCKHQNPDFVSLCKCNQNRSWNVLLFYFHPETKKVYIFCISLKLMEVLQHNNLVKGKMFRVFRFGFQSEPSPKFLKTFILYKHYLFNGKMLVYLKQNK